MCHGHCVYLENGDPSDGHETNHCLRFGGPHEHDLGGIVLDDAARGRRCLVADVVSRVGLGCLVHVCRSLV